MSETGYVYTLNDPRTLKPKYVGATKHPQRRLRDHENGRTSDDVVEWIEELNDEGLTPDMFIIDVVPITELPDREAEKIESMIDKWDLLNESSNRRYTIRDDNVENTCHLSASITWEQRDWLEAQEESMSQVVRNALDEYWEDNDTEEV